MMHFIHTADIHFGIENYGKIDTATGIHTRLLDFQKALTICIDYAIEKDVDFFLFAGDAYKTTHPTPTQQRLFFECFLRLFQAKIPVIMVIGNHDNPASFGKTHALDLFGQLPLQGFYVISQPQTIIVQTKKGPVQIVGIPWPSKTTLALNKIGILQTDTTGDYISKAVGSIIEHHAQQLNPELPAVLAAHLTVSSALFSGSEKRALCGRDPVFLPSQLAIKPFDYVALGHLHRYQNLAQAGHPAVVYSGSLERIDFGERKEEKGFCHVTIHNKQKTTHEFIQLPIRHFIQVTVHINDQSSHTEQIITELKKYTLDDAVVKIIYHVPTGLQDRVDFKTIYIFCERAMQLIGIFPVHQPKERKPRTKLHIEMDLKTLLTGYFTEKNISPERITQLIEKIDKLEEINVN